MTFQETLDFLYIQLPVFHRDGASAYKKDLTRTLELLDFFHNPHNNFKSVHIAGTNGKGSSSHFLASILQESGYKTGLYTSPHIKDFGERVKINGEFIGESFVIDFVEQVRPLLDEIQPSFFELTVAMAYQYFSVNNIDIAVIETGLGGRLDSTNVITPLVSLITNISYDHADLLGNTLQEIASEKAGIIKPKVPVVVSEKQAETQNVFRKVAASNHSDLIFASDEYAVSKEAFVDGKLMINIIHANAQSTLQSGLTGGYQLKNIAGVLATIDQLRMVGLKITHEAVEKGISDVQINTNLKGRWQVLQNYPFVVCDIAHNEAGITEVLKNANQISHAHLHVIIGMVRDKDLDKVLSILPSDATYYFSQAHSPRALLAVELKEKALKYGLNGRVFDDVNTAIESAKSSAQKEDLILICGSTFLVAEIDNI